MIWIAWKKFHAHQQWTKAHLAVSPHSTRTICGEAIVESSAAEWRDPSARARCQKCVRLASQRGIEMAPPQEALR